MAITEQITTRLAEILKDVDLATTSERQIREQLAKDLGIDDMAPYKPIVRQQIQDYLASASPAEDEADVEDAPAPQAKRRRASAPAVGGSGPELSPELAAIVGHTHMKRTEVVKALWQYIKANDLQDPSNRQHIILDSKLATIFEPPVTAFSMNKQLSKHIVKSEGNSRARKSSGGTPAGGKKYSGFNKLIVLSDDMAEWYGKPHAARAEVVKYFHSYIKEHNLKDPANKQFVLCDEALQKLTGQKRFKAFGVVKFINKHFLVDEEVVLDEDEEEEDDEDEEEEEEEDEEDGNAEDEAMEEAPAAKEEPVAAKEEPVAAKEEPAAAKEEPVAAKEEPAAAKEEPAAAKEEPAAAKEEPAAAKEEPAAAKEEPVAATEEPVVAGKEEPTAPAVLEPVAKSGAGPDT